MWKKNRFLPLVLASADMCFWLFLRDLGDFLEKYPFLTLIYDARVQFAAFLLLGFLLAWACHAWRPKAGLRAWLIIILLGGGCVAFQQAYNFLFARWGKFYIVNPWLQLGGICAGAAAGTLILSLSGDRAEPAVSRVPLTDISAHRDHLMGVGMLCVVLLHSGTVYTYSFFPLSTFSVLGGIGVDIFLFVSGIGMVYSLSRDPSPWNFYKRRVLRIFPEAMPWIAAFSLLFMFLGIYSLPTVILNCLGISGIVGAKSFNWYLSFLLLFYLLTPLLYRMLRGERARGPWLLALIAATLLTLFFMNDILKKTGLLIGIARFPIFTIGLLAGFWLKEEKALSRGEYRSLLFVTPLLLASAWLMLRTDLRPMTFSVLGCYCLATPALCLALSRAFDRVRAENCILRFLRWSGKNSLLIYVWNIILKRLYEFILVRYIPTGRAWHFLAGCLYILANYLIVYLIQCCRRILAAKR